MNPGTPPQYPTAQLPKPRKMTMRRVALGLSYLATAGVFAAIGAAAGGSTQTPAAAAPAPTVTITTSAPAPAPIAATTHAAAPKPTPKPTPVKATIPDGDTVVVGTDVPAGRYDAHSSDDMCYWEISKTASPDDIVSNDLGSKGHLVVTLKRGQTFTSDSCGDWTQE